MTENLQYRLYNASIEPPVDAWPKIAGQLDQTAQEHLAHTLQEAELEPPADAWKNIAAALDADARPNVIHINRTWKKWAVAAVAASIIIIAGIIYLRPAQPAVDGTASTTEPQRDSNLITNTTPQSKKVSEQDKGQQQTQTSNTVVTVNNGPRMLAFTSNTTTPIRYAHVDGAGSGADNNNDNVRIEEAIDQNPSIHPGAYISRKEYLTVAAPNGQPAKISAKFTDAVGFIFNNEPTENLDMAIRSFSWQQRFRNWSNKLMSNAAFIPAATNFLDIVELEELLKE